MSFLRLRLLVEPLVLHLLLHGLQVALLLVLKLREVVDALIGSQSLEVDVVIDSLRPHEEDLALVAVVLGELQNVRKGRVIVARLGQMLPVSELEEPHDGQ